MPSFSPFPPPTPASRFLLPRYLAIQSIPVSASPYKDAQLVLLKVELSAHPTSASSHASALEQRLVDPFALSPSPRSISPRAIHVGARKGGKSRWGEEEHETNEMERESLGNGREGMEATEGSDAMNHVHCSTGVGQRVSLRPPPYVVFACQRWVAMQPSDMGSNAKEIGTNRPPCFLLECGNYSCNRRSTSAPFHAHCTQLSAPHPFRFQLKVFPASCLTHSSFRFVIGGHKK